MDSATTRQQLAAHLATRGLADNTITIYCALVHRWREWAHLHGHDPDRPDALGVRAWARDLPGTAALRHQARAAISHYCQLTGCEDVAAAIPVPRRQRRQPRGLPTEQARQLVATARESGLPGLAVLVGLYTAARRAEIASLAWHRVDWDRDEVTLERPKTRDLHAVPLAAPLRAELAARYVPGEWWVFPGRWGGHVTPATVWQWVLDVADAAGVGHVTPHQLRHTALTEANDRTRDLRAVQDLAGHTDPAVTARYTRMSQERLRAAVDALDWGAPEPVA